MMQTNAEFVIPQMNRKLLELVAICICFIFMPSTSALCQDPVICFPLREFDRADWNAIASAFEGAPEFALGQHWKKDSEAGFRGGRVRIGWREDRMLFFAELQDDQIVTKASRRNELFFKTGDVFELFAGVPDVNAYIEYHVSPNNVILQLRFSKLGAVNEIPGKKLDPFFIEDNDAVLKAKTEAGRWLVYGELPASSVPGAKKSLDGQVWQISFCRYDYSVESGPFVLSSTAPYEKPDYHRRHEWPLVRFEARPSAAD